MDHESYRIDKMNLENEAEYLKNEILGEKKAKEGKLREILEYLQQNNTYSRMKTLPMFSSRRLLS